MSWAGKELGPLYRTSPWADDPYDAFVSFAIFFTPALTALLLVRLPLCKEDEPLVAGRVVDLVRTGKLLLAVVAVTLGGEWVALGLRNTTIAWSAATALDVLMLTGLTALTILCVWLVVTAPQLHGDRSLGTPDGLADAVATSRLVASRLGPLAIVSSRLISTADRLVVQPARRHPTSAAALVATLFGLGLAAPASLEEGVGPVLLVFIVVGGSAMFSFLMIGGAYLHLVTPARPLTGSLARGRDAVVAAAAAVPLALAFRDPIWSLIGRSTEGSSPAALVWLLVTAALIAFVAVFVGESIRG